MAESGPVDDARNEGYLSPHDAAVALRVSPSGLRRLAEIYVSVRGELPRETNTRSRLWPRPAVEELAAARRLVLSHRVGSIREALEALEAGEVEPLDPGSRMAGEGAVDFPGGPSSGSETAGLRSEIASLAGLREELGRIGDEVAALREVLERLVGSLGRAGETPSQSRGAADCERLRRRLAYLERELELREP